MIDLRAIAKALCVVVPAITAFIMWILLAAQSGGLETVMRYDRIDDNDTEDKLC